MGQVGRPAIKRTAAAGVGRWVPVRYHATIESGWRTLQGRGFQLVAAHLSEHATDFRALDYTRPTAVLLGQEKEGVPEEAAALADHHILIPMAGLAESLKVSVAAAVILFEAQRQDAGLYDHCRLDDETLRRTLFEWLQPRIARYCRQRGIPYPPLDDDGHVMGGPDEWSQGPIEGTT